MKTLNINTIIIILTLLFSFANGQQLKILTYNIFHGEKYYEPGNSNIDAVAELINKHNPDFVALQEVDSMTARSARLNNGIRKDIMLELSKKTGMNTIFGKAMNHGGGGYGEGILSKQPIESQLHQLPTPKGGEPRVLLTTVYTLKNGKKIILAGTHLCHEYEENRIAQAEYIADFARKSDIPVVVLGDFNFNPNEEPYYRIIRSMKDAMKEFGNPQLTYPYDNPAERLDYIFLDNKNNWKIKKINIIQNNASDHVPVIAVLNLKIKK